jgi:hypothetical protein
MIVNVCMQKTNAHIIYSAELSFNVFNTMISRNSTKLLGLVGHVNQVELNYYSLMVNFQKSNLFFKNYKELENP